MRRPLGSAHLLLLAMWLLNVREAAAQGDAAVGMDTPAVVAAHPSADPPAAPDGPQPVAVDAQAVPADTAHDGAPQSDPSGQNVPYHWLDRTHDVLFNTMWHSAEHVDRWFGSVEDDTVYQQVYGSIAPALLYTQYNDVQAQMRFNMNIPLPEINDRFHAFIGRFDPNEFITERDEPSGAFPRTYGPQTEDQTLLGIGYHQAQDTQQGGRFDAGTGIRLAVPMDPFIKGSWIFERGASETGLFSVRETLFWELSEGAGETTRLDLEQIYQEHWLVRYTASATRSQQSEGLLGYSSILVLHDLGARRAIDFEVECDGQTEAPVPLHDYGFKAAYRKGIVRRWLIMELRASIDWPKDYIWQRRSTSLGAGIGFEMLFGTDAFLARPVTF